MIIRERDEGGQPEEGREWPQFADSKFDDGDLDKVFDLFSMGLVSVSESSSTSLSSNEYSSNDRSKTVLSCEVTLGKFWLVVNFVVFSH